MRPLFSERFGGAQPRVHQQLTLPVKAAILQIVSTRMEDNAFGGAFPLRCPDGPVNAGTDENAMKISMAGFRVIWPQDHRGAEVTLQDPQLFDLIEYAYEHVAVALPGTYHGFFSHYHYGYDQDQGRASFAEEINRLFERNGIAHELKFGQIDRIAPMVLNEALAIPVFKTGDATLDELLSTARSRFLSRDEKVRGESLEKLWDAWERLKTLSDPTDKKRSIKALLDRVSSEPELRQRVETEAKQLTEIGNTFLIRHSEVGKVPIQDSIQVDYLFHRLFAFIRLVLQAHGVAL